MSLAELLPEQDESRVSQRPNLPCPGLLSTERWDEPQSLRGEIHSAERLVEHAVDVARAHGVASTRITPGPLRARVVLARTRIREAYAALSEDLRHAQREPLPAEEWLLDNSHVVEDQLREIQEDLPWSYLIELPRISRGAMRGYPRVYGLCIDYLRHTDARLDLTTLSSYVLSYQRVSPLTIGELWAVPIMLRIGLILTVGALATPSDDARDRAHANAWAKRFIDTGTSPSRVAALLLALETRVSQPSAALLVQLLRRLRDHDAPLGAVVARLHERCAQLGATPAELTRREHLRQAADQVSVGNAISSMRAIGAVDWNVFFARVSAVEEILGRDPLAVYAGMEAHTRDRYRHAVEDLARGSKRVEVDVARAALRRAEEAAHADGDDATPAHVGYWLVDHGRRALEAELGYRPRFVLRARRLLEAHPSFFYLGTIAALTAAACAGVGWAGHALLARWLIALLVALFVFPASEMAIALANAVLVFALPPRVLPKLAFDAGVPSTARTLVVVPALFDRAETVQKLVSDLEIRALANLDENVHFALLSDFTDADTKELGSDDALVLLAQQGIDALNVQYPQGTTARFGLFHRERRWNETQRSYLGWERKRGKLEELNRLLRGATDTSFVHVGFDDELLRSVRYVITLDADTELPRETASRLIATMAHPLNRPVVDATGRVIRGHAILQPRVGTIPTSGRRSRYARIAAGPSGIDPYTTAVSDVYQDLFGEGSFVGKGIYDVDAFTRALAGRVPDDRLLSHDLLEGIFARSALVTDIEVLDEQPASYEVAAGRAHRWIRGDWQLLPWLLGLVPKSSFCALDRWKIVDNLRRSVLPIALVLLGFAGWLSHPTVAAWVSATLAVMFVVPVVARLTLALARTRSDKTPPFVGAMGDELAQSGRQALTGAVFVLDQALVSADAIVRTLHRLALSKRNLLEWKTMSESERLLSSRGLGARGVLGVAIAIVGVVAVAWRAPLSLSVAAPVLLLWMSAPAVASWLRRPALRDEAAPLADRDQRELRQVARRTWHFFETFVTAADNHLPPDNFQEDPRGVVAHRTSPTNIGLYLLSVVAARDFGYLTLGDVERRLGATLDTIDRLERRNGHVLNWYETTSLAPLAPHYVSTVDSGNLAAYLWTLRQACHELASASLVSPAHARAAEDALRLATASVPADEAAGDADAMPDTLAGAVRALEALRARIETQPERLTNPWIHRATVGIDDVLREAALLAPFVALLDACPESLAGIRAELEGWRSLADIAGGVSAILGRLDLAEPGLATDDHAIVEHLRAALRSAEKEALRAIAALRTIGERAVAIADAMDFRFLLDPERELFSIGYNASSARLDGSHYDLLASEARLATLVAIAKGDATQEQWFRLGRPLAATTAGQRSLLSWSGSMFEYLMPLLVTRAYPDTLLTETYHAVLARQVEYGREIDAPWGVSESAYNLMDMRLTYQYRAFGVPGLGLKTGLGEDRVIAPYASGLAALVRPDLAAQNYRALAKEHALGIYGFYEAVDYTESHLPPGRRSVVVKAFMAHHQGMTLVALDNALNGQPMQRRFHADPRIMATELLLEERVPVRTPLVALRSSTMPAPLLGESDLDAVEHVGLGDLSPTRVHLLGHGELSTLVTARGDGFTTWKGMDVHRFREDHALGGGGTYVYVRDLDLHETWSVGQRPTKKVAEFYDAAFSIDRVELRRRDGDIETVTEIVVSPEHPTELRRITLTNHGDDARRLDLTTYGEIVLAPRGADVAHPAFSNLFVEVEALPERSAMLAKRRPRSVGEAEAWVVEMLIPDEGDWGVFTFEGSRARFLGRGRDLSQPAALDFGSALSGTMGAVLDPVIALRREITIAPGGRARLTFATALASSRAEALELLDTYATPGSVPRTFELAWADARVELKYLGVGAPQAHRFQRLLSAMVYPQAKLRHPSTKRPSSRGRSALWTHGISGDLPALVLRLDDPDFVELLREALLAHEYFRLNGMSIELVVLNEEAVGYLQPTQDSALAIIRSTPAEQKLDQRGGVFLRRTREMSEDDRAVLLGFARVVLCASRGSLARQLRELKSAKPALAATPLLLAKGAHTRDMTTVAPRSGRPRHANGIGDFVDGGAGYLMHLDANTRTPAPWSNVLANARFGTLVTETGGGFTWAGNSQRHRITPWSNDPISDPSGELLYLRDEEDGSVRSLTPEPTGGDAVYAVRHSPSFSTFEHERGDLAISLRVSVAASDPVKIFHVRVHHRGTKARTLSLFGMFEWVLGQTRETSRVSVVTEWDAVLSTLFAWNPLSAFPENLAFVVSTAPVRSVTGDRDEFFGIDGSRARPAALDDRSLSGRTGGGFDPCAALQVPLRLEPGATVELAFVLGDASSADEGRALAAKYRDFSAVVRAEAEASAGMGSLLDRVSVHTPDPLLDAMMNHWLLHQVASCRLRGRSGFYQSGGAYGYRDQLQDVLALLHTAPQLAREHIVRAAARQFVEGDVQHWWHPEDGQGVRTRCSDDMLWLPYAVATYVRVTGDRGILDEEVPFLRSNTLRDEDDDAFSAPAITTVHASLYEHCCRALDVGTTAGEHGLPLMRGGDWNDGMNRVGRGGKGESVWLAWFLGAVAGEFAEVASSRGDGAREATCKALVASLARAVEGHAWDGEWYRRASFDDGTPLGSHDDVECRIDAIAQSWSVLAGFGDPERARRALDASMKELVQEEPGLMRLLWPPFEGLGRDPGYIAAYPPGIRENGGQYTHGVLWTVQALTRLGEGERAAKLLALLLPANHAATPEGAARYAIEPYVLAGDVYDGPHAGRGGWSWYTGSASWMYRIVLEDVLGVRRVGDALELVPCISRAWREYDVVYRFGKSQLRLHVANPDGLEHGEVTLVVDGAPLPGNRIPLVDDGAAHEARATLRRAAAKP